MRTYLITKQLLCSWGLCVRSASMNKTAGQQWYHDIRSLGAPRINIEITNNSLLRLNHDRMCITDSIKMLDISSAKKIIKYEHTCTATLGPRDGHTLLAVWHKNMQKTTSKHDESIYFILKELNSLAIQIILRNKYYIWRYSMTTSGQHFSRYYSKWSGCWHLNAMISVLSVAGAPSIAFT